MVNGSCMLNPSTTAASTRGTTTGPASAGANTNSSATTAVNGTASSANAGSGSLVYAAVATSLSVLVACLCVAVAVATYRHVVKSRVAARRQGGGGGTAFEHSDVDFSEPSFVEAVYLKPASDGGYMDTLADDQAPDTGSVLYDTATDSGYIQPAASCINTEAIYDIATGPGSEASVCASDPETIYDTVM